MTPLHPDLRRALKEAHPGLTDEVIDEYEELTARRQALERRQLRESMHEIDRRREELLKTRMPQYAQVAQAVAARGKPKDADAGTRFAVDIVADDSKQGKR